jgi:putative aldouronate transport system substrate-binding protein
VKKTVKAKKRPQAMAMALAVALAAGAALCACGGTESADGSSQAAQTTQAEQGSQAGQTTQAAQEAQGTQAEQVAQVPEASAPKAASEPNYFGDNRIAEDKITLKAIQGSADSASSDDNSLWFYEELEKETNVHVQIEGIKESDWQTKVNLMFASGEYPDLILTSPVDIEDYGVSQGILLPLDEYIVPEIMPNYFERLQMNSAGVSIPASDGQSYFIGKLIAQNVNHEANWFINKLWLDSLGLPIPSTVDELTDTLRAFRDNDPNGNGEKDEIPASFCTQGGMGLRHNQSGVINQFSSFGIPMVDAVYGTVGADDKVTFPGYLPGFRAGCEWMNTLYSEGLMDPESLTQDVMAWLTKINEVKVGYFTYLRLLNAGLSQEALDAYVSMKPARSEYGVSVPAILEVPTVGAILTVANKYPVETLKWIDAQLETRTMMIAYNGPDKLEGGPTMEDGSPVEPTIFVNGQGKYEIIYVPEDNGLYDYVPVLMAQFFAPGDYYFGIYEMPPHRVERYNYSVDYADILEPKSYYRLYRLSKLTNDESIEAQRIHVQIQTLMDETLSDFITKGVTDAKWDSFISTTGNIGVDEYVSLYQDAYDRYLESNRQ